MTRPLFDPSKIAGPAKPASIRTSEAAPAATHSPPPSPAPSPGPAAWSVSQLASAITRALSSLPDKCKVVGEVSGFRERTHWYFDLKDEDAVIACAVFANVARRALMPQTGDKVVLTGRLDFYAKAGKVTFIVEKIEPLGAGALDAALKRLVEEARALGWLAQERKRPLPQLPRRIAIITSRSGAALQDVLVTLAKRCPGIEVALLDTRVQGDDAVPEIIEAIHLVSTHAARLRIDALLLTRGGGSMEDLWCFNHKDVAQAIVQSSIPVVAAIGHETDTTLAELVADERCATPTQAAMRLAPDRDALLREVDASQRRLTLLLERTLRELAYRLEQASNHPFLADPRSLLELKRDRLDDAADALQTQMRARLSTARERLAHAASGVHAVHPRALLAASSQQLISLESRLWTSASQRLARDDARLEALSRALRAMGPHHVLARGYSLTTRADGRVLRSIADAAPGEQLTTRVSDGSIRSRVDGQGPDGPMPPVPIVPLVPPSAPASKPRIRWVPKSQRGPQAPPQTPSLFDTPAS